MINFSTLILMCAALVIHAENLRPTVGILTQEASQSMLIGEEGKTSYIAASYVKFMESAGARVVPIMINQTESYYDDIASSVNAILFPGGGVAIDNSSGYGMAGQILYEKVLEKNANGIYLPLWATCLGFEMLIYLASGYNHFLTSCDASNIALPLEIEPGYEESLLFKNMPQDVFDIFTTQNVTANFHIWCYTREDFATFGLDNNYRILTVNHDPNDLEFLSTVEHLSIPIFGTQWHPEKDAYEWKNDAKHDSIPHWKDAVHATQYFADFFVENARQNDQTFASQSDEDASLIYGYSPKYVGNNTSSSFVQIYLF